MALGSQPGQATIWDTLQRIDRRILYLILIIVIAIPTLRPVKIPNSILPMSRKLWETIDSTPKDKIVLLSSTWAKSTRGENGSQMRALLDHLMTRRIRFALSSFVQAGAQVGLNEATAAARKYNYVYGQDWVYLGFQSSDVNFIKGINVDFIGTLKKDAKNKADLATLPVMQGIRSIDDVHIVVEVSASGSHLSWIEFLKAGVKLGFCPTSVMAPEALPYVSSGQLAGLLWGAKGAYDYEQLNKEHGTGDFGPGRKYMGPLSAAFALVILSIAVGNIAMFFSRRRAAGGEA